MTPAPASDVGSAIQIAVARKSLDSFKQTGDAMVGLIQDAAQVAKAGRGAVSPTPGTMEIGRSVDVKG